MDAAMEIIGRQRERQVLSRCESSGKPEFVAVYGRRRVGKTFLFFTLFHFRFLEGRKEDDPHFWTNFLSYPAHKIWCGYAFERLCMAHIGQIKQKLGISGVITKTYAFRSAASNVNKEAPEGGAQIDMIIDRKDDVVNLCECKYIAGQYALTEPDMADIERKKSVFMRETGTKKAIHVTMITTNGLARNAYCNEIQSEITLDDLFLELV